MVDRLAGQPAAPRKVAKLEQSGERLSVAATVRLNRKILFTRDAAFLRMPGFAAETS